MIDPRLNRYLWLLFIIVTVANAVVLKVRSKRHILANAELAPGYDTLFRGILFWGSLPWLVMAAGILLGHVEGLSAYFHPRDGNPFVIAWFATAVVIWVAGLYWIFARRGAELLIDHPGLFHHYPPKRVRSVQIVACLSVASGVAATLVMWFGDVRISVK